LFADGKGGVVEGAILEKILFALLEFDDEFFAPLILTVEVKDGLAVNVGVAELFGF